jgi:hypothetical protein
VAVACALLAMPSAAPGDDDGAGEPAAADVPGAVVEGLLAEALAAR